MPRLAVSVQYAIGCLRNMSLKIAFTFVIILCGVGCKEVTFVIDTTQSMDNEIGWIKRNVGPFLENTTKSSGSKIDNFIVVPFNDPHVQTTSLTQYPDEFASVLASLEAGGGSECRENTLLAIYRALELVQNGADIFVFTDAYARPFAQIDELNKLCAAKKSRVTVFLTGKCVSSTNETAGDGFDHLYPACSGLLYNIEAINIKEAFDFVTELVSGDWVTMADKGSFYGRKQIIFKSTATINGLLIAISGDYPSLEAIVDKDNKEVEIRKIVDTKKMLVVMAPKLPPGDYSIKARSQDTARVVFYTKQRFPFDLGFSTQPPRNLRETSSTPLPGRSSYMLLTAASALPMDLSSVKITNVKSGESAEATVERRGDNVWMASFFFDADVEFRITVTGEYKESGEHFEETSKILTVQEMARGTVPWTIPTVEILEVDPTVEYGRGARFACLVSAYPEPRVTWEGDSKLEYKELILLGIPSSYLSYVDINPEEDVTVTCKAENARGQALHQTRVTVRRPAFMTVTPPSDTTIPYQGEGALTCAVRSYPHSTIKWYHNETEVVSTDNVMVEGDRLSILRMRVEDVGTYKCDVSNSIETQTHAANIEISGIELPVIDKAMDSGHTMKSGERCLIECRLNAGKPAPNLTWSYKNDDYDEFDKVPAGVTVSGQYLDISSVSLEHKGTYRCLAVNEFGQDSWETTVNVQFAPVIYDAEDVKLVVREGGVVEVECEVRGDPAPSVHWWRERRSQAQPVGSAVQTDERNTLAFTATWSDAGVYRCKAENEVGTAEKVVTVEVHVSPYIQPAEYREVRVRAGEDVTLPCEVQVASPEPSITWYFVAVRGLSKLRHATLGNRVGMSYPYQIDKASVAQSGTYMCVAANEIGTDNIKYTLKVV